MNNYHLVQDRLDVINKTRSNLFDWRGQFTPQLIEYLLSVFANPGDVVVDPFSGSGTVLLEALRLGCNSYGYEINPSAYYMSKFYEYCKLSEKERFLLIDEIRNLLGVKVRDLNPNLMVYEKNENYRVAYTNLLDFAKYTHSVVPSRLIPFVINVLFMSEKDKKLCLKDSLIKNINALKELLLSLPYTTHEIQAKWSDARTISKNHKEDVDVIITSPPYINVFNYHQNYRGIVECFDYNLLNVANSEIGSNRKNRQNRFKTVVQYAIDMGHVIQNCASSLKVGGVMVWIVGRYSNVRKVAFYNSNIISDIVNIIPGIEIVQTNQRSFGNRFGENIIEDILIIRKTSQHEDISLFKSFEAIGLMHLENALPMVSHEDRPDIEALINTNSQVVESPILNQYDTIPS